MRPLARLAGSALVLVLALDLATKALIQSQFQLEESKPLLPGLALTYVMNPGAAFSLFAGAAASWRQPAFIVIALIALAALWRYFRSLPEADNLSGLAIGLIAGGALGNLVDRLRYGQVVDFIEVGVRSVYTWPIFNVADSAVCVGVGLLIVRSFKPLETKAS
jgi:signal peptidase II